MNTTDNQPSENLISDDDSLKPDDTPIKSHFFRRHGRKIAGALVLLIFIGTPLLLATIKFLEKLQIGHHGSTLTSTNPEELVGFSP